MKKDVFLNRLVHENHSAATKKNKEWQEKLPVVVLKAEEIMYSKANSEVLLFSPSCDFMMFELNFVMIGDGVCVYMFFGIG